MLAAQPDAVAMLSAEEQDAAAAADRAAKATAAVVDRILERDEEEAQQVNEAFS
jgi:hypothetical protein